MDMKVNGKRIRPARLALMVGMSVVIFYLLRRAFVSTSYDAEPVDPIYEFIQQNHGSNNDFITGSRHPAIDVSDEFLSFMDLKTHKCPDYVEYSRSKHAPFSSGKYAYPYMRPAPKCRTFTSKAVEQLIDDLKTKVLDADLARLIENCLPNTLDTTILWHKSSLKDAKVAQPQTFVVTGDIHAEWLRDSARQLSVYQPLVKYDADLQELIKGAINTQAKYVLNSPYCNAFHPPAGSGVKKGESARDGVFPKPDWEQVFECKYEIDSLASFLTLSNEYLEHSGDSSFLTQTWFAAYEKLLVVFKRESQPSFDEESGRQLPFYYSFQRHTNIGSETLPLGGVGNPVNYGTGLVRSAFRPSDDSCILQFFVPGNIHALTELRKVRENILTDENNEKFNIQILLDVTDKFIESMSRGIEEHAIVNHPTYGKVYAYEVDGYGSATFMDDANIPSLLSIPDLGYTSVDDEVYQNTRKMILEKSGNPYYLKGNFFEGIGGPHVGLSYAWPMSLLVRIRTTDDDEEIKKYLQLVMENTGGLGLMHEGVNVQSPHGTDYTRPWFAWCNSEFAKTILHLAKHKPHLIFKKQYSDPYDIDALFESGTSIDPVEE